MFTKAHSVFAILALIFLSLSAPGYCESAAKSAPESKPERTRVDGTRTFYEPGNVKKSGDKVSFMAYSSPYPKENEEVDEFSINCSTHDMSSKEGGRKEWSPPSPLLAGETMYPIAKRLCEWGPGFWQKLTD